MEMENVMDYYISVNVLKDLLITIIHKTIVVLEF